MTEPSSAQNSVAYVDKDHLYGRFEEGERKRQKERDDKHDLYMKAGHKALDIGRDAEGDLGDINANRTVHNHGVPLGGAVMAVALTGLCTFLLFDRFLDKQQPQAPAAAPTQTKAPTDSEYMVRFYDKDGKPIDVPHISQKPK